MICIYNFLSAHCDDPMYEDSSEFTHPDLRSQVRSPAWVLERLEKGIQAVLGASSIHAPSRLKPMILTDRLQDATRLPGERAFLCEICKEKFGGETVFKAHRKYGTTRGRPAKNAQLKCYSLENTRFHLDENNVWRGVTPNFEST